MFAAIMAAKTPAVEPAWNPKAAAQYLDARAEEWLRWSGSARGQGTVCLSCHTTLPFALARPALGESAAEKQLLASVSKRVENWDKIVSGADEGESPFAPYYPNRRKASALSTEAVLNALVLVRRGNGPPAEKALGHLWEQQQADGSWLWLDFGLNPWEKEARYFGAALAALAVGTAGKEYRERSDLRPKVAALTAYLRTEAPSQPLHHRAVALWASSRLPEVTTADDRKALVDELLKVQEADGGWSLARLGKDWTSHGRDPKDTLSDGYATGLAVLALKAAGVGADHPQLKKALTWLAASQTDGAWPIHYPNKNRDPREHAGKFMRDAATAFAVLALTNDP